MSEKLTCGEKFGVMMEKHEDAELENLACHKPPGHRGFHQATIGTMILEWKKRKHARNNDPRYS